MLNTIVPISGQRQFVQSWTSIYTCLAMRMHEIFIFYVTSTYDAIKCLQSTSFLAGKETVESQSKISVRNIIHTLHG